MLTLNIAEEFREFLDFDDLSILGHVVGQNQIYWRQHCEKKLNDIYNILQTTGHAVC